MLERSLKKRLFLILSSLFIILIIYLFPSKSVEPVMEEKKSKDEETIVYLLDSNSYVSRVSVVTNEKDLINKAKDILNYLTINSSKSNYIKEGFNPIIPKNTKVLSISIDNKLMKINFSKDILKIDENNENKMISSIIYSLTSLKGIEQISIYVEGNILDRLPNSEKPLPTSLDRSFGINHVYDINKITGTTSTTIYYLSKYKDYYYYVPVTMINNDQKDKIEIIIEKLASKSVYQTSLISYINDTKKMSYEINNDYLLLNINKELFNNLNSNNLMESVIYSMNLSIKDNYAIKKVIYEVDNHLYKIYDI
jgi:germination protein M